MILRFEEWLTEQQSRKDVIGDFARVLDLNDIPEQFSRRKLDEHRNWADVVIKMAQPGCIDAFNSAWHEFVLAKQASLKALE
jgi:hypothetical protein